MPASNVMLFQFVGETVENAINAFVSPAATSVMNVVGGSVLIGVTLYLAITGALIIAGYLSNPFWDVVKQCVKIAFIGAIALSAGNYMDWVVGGINGIQEGLAGAMNTSAPTGTIYQTLDNSLNQAFDLVGECLQRSHEAKFNVGAAISWWSSGAIIGIGALFFTFVGGAIVITAKFALAVLFALGPFFIACLMFPVTARFFDTWFAQAMNYTFTIVVVAVFTQFGIAAFDQFVSDADVGGTNEPAFAALQILGVAGVLSWLLFQVGSFASGLAGGLSLASISIRQMASPVTSTARTVAGGISGTAGFLNKGSNRLDPKTGLQTQSSRLEHIAMGRTILNPAYQRAVLDHAKEGWGKNSVKGR